MTAVEINRRVLEKAIEKKLSDKDIKENISMFGTPVDKIEDNKIFIDVAPNRPDLLSDYGFGRAFASYLGIKKGLKRYYVNKSYGKVIVEGSVAEVRPQIVCAVVKGLKFDSEMIKEVIKIQEKLHITYGRNRRRCAIGIYPLEKISFPVKYAAKKPPEIRFRPLESPRIMSGAEILDYPVDRKLRGGVNSRRQDPIVYYLCCRIAVERSSINRYKTGHFRFNTAYRASFLCGNIERDGGRG